MRRLIVLFVAVLAMVATFITPAGARPPSAGAGSTNEKVTICHATRSLTNPYVVITIDVAAWQPDGPADSPRAHGPNHDREKKEVEWTDVEYNPDLGCPAPETPEPPGFWCAGTEFLYGANFYTGDADTGDPLWYDGRLRIDAAAFDAIPEGPYDVTLASWDRSHADPNALTQGAEVWYVDFGNDESELTLDLGNGEGKTPADAVSYSVGRVEILKDTTIVATHGSVANNITDGPNSVIPLCVGLTPVDGEEGSG